MRLFDLSGRTAIVTGASRGIGRAIALGFAEAGADVVAVGRTTDLLEEVAAAVRRLGRRALAVTADVTREADVRRVADETLREMGAVHILVNNAGVSPVAKPVDRLATEVWDEVIDTNLKSAFLMSRAVAPAMMRQRYGRIINVSSMLAQAGIARGAPYCPSKAATDSLTQCAAADWATHGINVNSLAPGFVETDMSAPSRRHQGYVDETLRRIPLRRWARPEDMVGAAVFLASPASDYVTATTLLVDGGMTRTWNPVI